MTFHTFSTLIVIATILLKSTSLIIIEPRCEKTGLQSGCLTWSDANRAVQSQKIARGLKFCIDEEEDCTSSETKLISAFLFSHIQKAGFLMTRLKYDHIFIKKGLT